MLEVFATQEFWVGLAKIIGVNIVLSGDNAVVIALAARSLPPKQQKQAILWGSGAAIVMRIVLTIFAVQLLTLPYLKLVGSLLLFWIGVQLLLPEDGDGDKVNASDNMLAAIKTILIADLVMSLDNVIAVAAAAGGSLLLLVLGLGISIPLVIFGSTLLLHLMERYPVIITIGGALLGLVAGEMLVSDPALDGWMRANFAIVGDRPVVAGMRLELIVGVIGAIFVVALGKWLAAKRATDLGEVEPPHELAPGPSGTGDTGKN